MSQPLVNHMSPQKFDPTRNTPSLLSPLFNLRTRFHHIGRSIELKILLIDLIFLILLSNFYATNVFLVHVVGSYSFKSTPAFNELGFKNASLQLCPHLSYVTFFMGTVDGDIREV